MKHKNFITKSINLAGTIIIKHDEKHRLIFEDDDSLVFFSFENNNDLQTLSKQFYNHELSIDPFSLGEVCSNLLKEVRIERERRRLQKLEPSEKEVSKNEPK